MNLISQKSPKGFGRGVMCKLAASYLIVVLLPMMVCGFMSKRSIEEVYRSEIMTLSASAQKTANSVSGMLNSMGSVIQLLGGEDDIYRLAEFRNYTDPEKVNSLIKIRSLISTLARTVAPGGELFVFSKELDFMTTTGSIYVELERSLERIHAKYGDYMLAEMIGADFAQSMKWKSDYFVIPTSTSVGVLAMGNTVSAKSSRANICMLFVLFPEIIEERLGPDPEAEYVVFCGDQAIACTIENTADLQWVNRLSKNELTDPESRRWMAAQAWSEENSEVRVVAMKSRQDVTNSVTHVVRNLMILYMSVCVMTLMLAFALAYINNKPFDQLLTLLFGKAIAHKQISYNWKLINESVRSLLADNQTLKEEMQNQNAGLCHSILYGLISGARMEQRAALNMLSKLGMQVEREYWGVLLRYEFDEETADPLYISMLMKKQLDRYFPEIAALVSVDAKRYFALVDGNIDIDRLKSVYAAMQDEILQSMGVAVHSAVVRIRTLADLPDAFITTQVMIHAGEEHEMMIVSGQMRLGGEYVYSAETGDQLKQAVRDGDSEQLIHCLETVENGCSDADAASIRMMLSAVYVDIGSVLIRMEGLPNDIVEQTIRDLGDLSGYDAVNYMRHVIYVMEPVMGAIRELRQRNLANVRSTGLGKNIIAFIDENIANPDLGLNMIAVHFGFSESYISGLIKSETDVGFAAYCEGRRMEIACSALDLGESITEAAYKAGYRSQHTFRRVFKKVVGVNPSEYVQKIRQLSEEE